MSVKVIDVADYVLQKLGTTSAMKLQKLVYYSQAWHLVWRDSALFDEPIQAWVNGPVVPELYRQHQRLFRLDPGFFKGNPSAIPDESKQVIDQVLSFYGSKDAQWLSTLTHMEEPWKQARIGLLDGERGSHEITLQSMAEYYSGL